MTDTVANLPEDYVKENNIYVISLYVIIDGKYYKDGIDISSDDMFKLNDQDSDFKLSLPLLAQMISLRSLIIYKKMDTIKSYL